MATTYLTTVQTAPYVRKALKKHFGRLYPSTTFSVQSKHSMIYVGWVDGPPEPLVSEALKLYTNSRDERETHYIDGTYICFGASSIQCNRRYTKAFLEVVGRKVAARYQLALPTITESRYTPGTFDYDQDWSTRVGDRTLAEVCYRECRETDWRDIKREAGREEVVEVVAASEVIGETTPAADEVLVERPYTVDVKRRGDQLPWSWLFLNDSPNSAVEQVITVELGMQYSPKWTAIRKCGAAYFAKDVDIKARIYEVLDPILTGQAVEAGVDKLTQPNGAKVAERFRDLAETQGQYAEQRFAQAGSSKQNTHRRVRIAESIEGDARAAERLEGLLLGAADAWEMGELHPSLKRVRHKNQIEVLLTYREMPRPGYSENAHRLMIKAGLYASTYGQARQALLELQQLISRESPEERRLRELRRSLVGVTYRGYFPTPRALAERMIELADIVDGMTALEPSGGSGHIAGPLRSRHPNVRLDVIEINPTLREILLAQGFHLIGHDMLEVDPRADGFHDGYDRIVANPMFEDGMDIRQTLHAVERLLATGGRYVGIVSMGSLTRHDAEALRFQAWLRDARARVDELPADTFLASDRATGVRTALVVVDKSW